MIELERRNPTASTAAAAALENGFRGRVIRPGDPGYDETRAVWNASIDRRPALIAQCTGAADVARAVSVAREHDLLVSVRGGGHNIAGLAVCDGGMMIDLSPMRGVHVDPAARTARAEPGTVWGEFDHETQAFGLATPGGLISSTGIAGFTLGGGFGWLSRCHGLACDTMLSADVVTAGGSRLTASATENPDLFWGLRGGGGNFGIVTSFEYRLVEAGPTVLAGLVVHPLERAAAVLGELSEQLVNAPREAMFAAFLRMAPPAPFLPPEVHGKHVMMLAMLHAGPLDDAERVLGPVRRVGDPIVDLVAPQPYVSFQAFSDRSWLRGMQNYWKAEYLNILDASAIDAIVDHAARITSPLSDIKLGALGGGAIADVADGDSAYAYRRAPYLLNINSRWAEPADADRHIEWTRSLWVAMRPHSHGGVYVNFLGDEGQDRVRAAYGDAAYDRLSVLKRRYDPDNFFRVNQNIRPADTEAAADDLSVAPA